MKTILELLKKAGGWKPDLYLRIESPPFMPLVIEALDEPGPCGLPSLSIAHYGERNGDLMCAPEMCFEFGFAVGGHLAPFYFRNDSLGIEQFSRTIEGDNYVFDRDLYDQHEQFAEVWDKNLRSQGFIAAFERRRTQR